MAKVDKKRTPTKHKVGTSVLEKLQAGKSSVRVVRAGDSSEEDEVDLPPVEAVFACPELVRAILLSVPLDYLATSLRWVNRLSRSTARELVEAKLFDKVKVIAFDRYEGGDWFRADVRRGWSDISLTSKERCVDEAIKMAACRCSSWESSCGRCGFKDKNSSDMKSCESNALKYGRIPLQGFDAVEAKALLLSKGSLRIGANRSLHGGGVHPRPDEESIVVGFNEGDLGLEELLQDLTDSIGDEVQYKYGHIPDSFSHFYGLEKSMYLPEFLRLLFVVFRDGPCPPVGIGRGRVESEVSASVSSAKVVIDERGSRFVRFRKFYRFRTQANEPVEIRLESMHCIY